LTVLLLVAGVLQAAGKNSMEGNPFRGRELLSEKLCTQCHSVWGHGGVLGPDLATAVGGKSWLDLVGDFWNHTPRMIDAMKSRGHSWPAMNGAEMADLLSYLYYLRLFDEPGDPTRGWLTYTKHRCAACHNLDGRGGSVGGPLDRYSAYRSPIVLAQAMWNAGPRMQGEQIDRGTAIPVFLRNEMADIQAYVRAQGDPPDGATLLLPLPDPAKGAAVFRSKRCSACHSPTGGSGPNLGRSALDKTVSEISGILWNHSYEMSGTMTSRGIPFPQFERTEMADLISYLYFLGFFEEKGEPDRGGALFSERGCAMCHDSPGGRAIDLFKSEVATDSMALAAAMWNHSPEMHELMGEQTLAWPTFDAGEMEDLASFLRRRASSEKGE
jgi:mono/diheme cytochrome c family protein